MRNAKGFSLVKAACQAQANVLRYLRQAGFGRVPSWPWILLDGKLLHCEGDACVTYVTPAIRVPIDPKYQIPQNLHQLVCPKLDPQPEACKGYHKAQPSDLTEGNPGACETCVETSSYTWRQDNHLKFSMLPILVVLSIVLGGVLLMRLIQCTSEARGQLEQPKDTVDQECAVE